MGRNWLKYIQLDWENTFAIRTPKMKLLKGRLATNNQNFFVSNDTMKGPESRKKIILNYENLCHCENTPFTHIRIREKISNGPVGRGLRDVTRRQFIKNSTGKLFFLPAGLTIKKRRMASVKCSRATTGFSTSYGRGKYWLIYQKPGGQEKG